LPNHDSQEIDPDLLKRIYPGRWAARRLRISFPDRDLRESCQSAHRLADVGLEKLVIFNSTDTPFQRFPAGLVLDDGGNDVLVILVPNDATVGMEAIGFAHEMRSCI